MKNKIRKIYQDFFDEYIELFPSCNDYLNIKKYSHMRDKLENSLDDTHIERQKRLYRKYIKVINSLDKKSLSKDAILYNKVLKFHCSNALEFYRYNFILTPINHMENLLIYIFEMASGETIFEFNNKNDYHIFIRKINIFPKIVDSIIAKFRKGAEINYTLPKILAEKLYKQLGNAIKQQSYHNKNIKYKLDFDYNNILDVIFIPKTKELMLFLKNIYIPKCRNTIGMCHLINGPKEYKYLVKSSISLNMDIEKIHQYGMDEVERIYNEKLKIKEILNFNGTQKQFEKYLKNRKDLKYKNKTELINSYKIQLGEINDTIMKTYFYENVRNKCHILPVPKYNEPFSAEAYYMGGDLENKRRGKFYINLKNYKDNNRIEVESLTLHEANPGHHYEITKTLENKNIPLFIKCSNNDAYQEGWALYCENLGEYKTAESYYGKLNIEMTRALRLVVDTGIHYYGWSFDKSFKIYKKYSFDSNEQIKTQLMRYIAIPSQALSYKIGEKFIMDLLEKFKKNPGNKSYDSNQVMKEFHHRLLKYGPIPLNLIEL